MTTTPPRPGTTRQPRHCHRASPTAASVRVATIAMRKRTTLHCSMVKYTSQARANAVPPAWGRRERHRTVEDRWRSGMGRPYGVSRSLLRGPCVQLLHLVLEVAHHDVALELQARGEVAVLLGEVALEDRELADRLR